MLTVRSLGSGSSGNALLVDAAGTTLLVDCGIGARALTAGLRAADRTLATIDAVLLTHEHADHVRALPQLLRAKIPVIATRGTAVAAELPRDRQEVVRDGRPFSFGAVTITPLAVSHDAAEPCAFHIESGDGCLLVATDLGCSPEGWHDRLAACDVIVIEANHDEGMLRAGPYPAHLKRRVLSERGHLSNATCGALLAAALQNVRHRAPAIWLAHLSRTNNRPGLAEATVSRLLAARAIDLPVGALPRQGSVRLWPAGNTEASPRQLPLLLG